MLFDFDPEKYILTQQKNVCVDSTKVRDAIRF